MSRLIAACVLAWSSAALAQPASDAPASDAPASDAPTESAPADSAPVALAPTPAAPEAPAPAPTAADAIGDQAVSVQLGLAAGGNVTPGGLRIAGHYLYQLSDRDWFDGAASFTFGSGQAACFRDRDDAVVCDHGLTDGTGVEVVASVRRVFRAQGAFLPYARVGIGIGAVRFSDDDVSGIAIPLHGAGGVRVAFAPSMAVVVEGELTLGIASLNRDLGTKAQLGLAVTGGVEFRLR